MDFPHLHKFDNNGPILLIMGAENCGYCIKFEKEDHLERLIKLLLKDNRVTPHTHEVKSMAGGIKLNPKVYHPDIASNIFFFPTFLLIDRRCWVDHTLPFRGVVLKSERTEDGKVVSTLKSIEAKYIYGAVKQILDSNPMFQSKGKAKSKSRTKPTEVQKIKYTQLPWPQKSGSGTESRKTRIAFQPWNIPKDGSSRTYRTEVNKH